MAIFELHLVTPEDNHWPREYMQLEYSGDEGVHCLEFSQREVKDLKESIRKWEAEFYG